MIKINLSREVDATLERVWGIVSDINNEPFFWPDMNSANNISKNGNMIEREVTVGFSNSRSRQTVLLNPKESIRVSMNKGPLRGIRGITLSESAPGNNRTRINLSWDIDLYNIPILGRSFVRINIIKEIEEALNRTGEIAE
jgi:ribosome-associated toxin RatA of RatAB toxin-antitoxin module